MLTRIIEGATKVAECVRRQTEKQMKDAYMETFKIFYLYLRS